MRMKLAPKRLTTYVPRRSKPAGVTMRQELELRRMAALIPNEQVLLGIIAQTKPEMRIAGLERLRPYLKFRVSQGFTEQFHPLGD